MVPVRNRNKPCWCGSGEKYKKCHRDREAAKPPELWAAAKSARSIMTSSGQCLYPDPTGQPCTEKVIAAHTVRRSADLRAIAESGHVYAVSADLEDMERNSGQLAPKRIGIKRASTFLGFCSKHDSAAFAPLETTALVPTDQQALLLMYRAVCRELYVKQRQIEMFDLGRTLDSGKTRPQQENVQRFFSLARAGAEASLQNLSDAKHRLDSDILNNDFSNIRFVSISLSSAPEVMCSGLVAPSYSFNGEQLQRIGDLSKALQLMSVSLASTQTGGVAVFAWRLEDDMACGRLVDSLNLLPEPKQLDSIVGYVFSHIENLYFRISWWDALSEPTKQKLVGKLHENIVDDGSIAPPYSDTASSPLLSARIMHTQQKRA